MCLAVPGVLIAVREGEGGLPFGRARFGSVVSEVCLAYTPEAKVGDWVIVHVGFAIQTLDEAAARRALELLDGGPTRRAAR